MAIDTAGCYRTVRAGSRCGVGSGYSVAGTGHRAAVLLKIYARRNGWQADAASRRITGALGTLDARPAPDIQEDGDSEQAS